MYDKVQEKLEEYKEGVMRRFSPSRAHQNIIQLIGSFSDEKRLILVYGFPFKVCLGDQLNGMLIFIFHSIFFLQRLLMFSISKGYVACGSHVQYV